MTIRTANAFAGVVLLATALNSRAWPLYLPSFGMDVHDDWKSTVEARPRGKLVRLQPVGADGQLKVTSYEVPQVITEDRLRTMTNVDERVPLTWQRWGFRNCGQVTAEQ